MSLQPAFDAAGVAEVTGGFYRQEGAADDALWLATDLGLAIVHGHAAQTKHASELHTERWTLELCPWADVINPEVSIEVRKVDGRPHARIRLLIQLPRVDLVGGGEELTPLVTAVMRAKGR